MTEANFTLELLRELRRHLPNAVIFKHADGYTKGVPDFSITLRGLTAWFEVKLCLGTQLTMRNKAFEPAQWETLRRLNGYYVLWFDPPARAPFYYRGGLLIYVTHPWHSREAMTFCSTKLDKKMLVAAIIKIFQKEALWHTKIG